MQRDQGLLVRGVYLQCSSDAVDCPGLVIALLLAQSVGDQAGYDRLLLTSYRHAARGGACQRRRRCVRMPNSHGNRHRPRLGQVQGRRREAEPHALHATSCTPRLMATKRHLLACAYKDARLFLPQCSYRYANLNGSHTRTPRCDQPPLPLHAYSHMMHATQTLTAMAQNVGA